MIRILKTVPDGFPTFRADIAALFGKYLPRLGVGADLIAQASEVGSAPAAAWGGGRVMLCERTGSRSRDQLRALVHDVRELRRCTANEYQAIQVRDKVFAALYALWIGWRRDLPVFYWMSFPMSERYIAVVREEGHSIGIVRWLFLVFKGYVGKALLYRVVLPRCTHVFVQSERMRDDVAAHGIPRERMTPVPMGVDLERSLPSRAEAHAAPALEGRQVIAYLGTFDRPRRLEFLLEVFQRLAPRLPDARLLMIGDGPLPEDRERLEAHAASLGIADRIVWTGWVSPEDAWRWLVRADVAVSLFPRGELLDSASPTKVVEYMALGIPVVANDQPDQAQVLRDSGAGLCAPMEHAEFAVALETILSNPELAHGMRVAGPPYVAAHRGYAHIADEVASVYRRYVGMKEYTCGSQVSQA